MDEIETSEERPDPSAGEPEAVEGAAAGEPDEDWLVDEETGREYRITEIPKREVHRRLEEEEGNLVRFRYGVVFEVVRETDDHFYVKEYRSERESVEPGSETEAAAPEAPGPEGPTEEELAEIAATFESEVEAGDRLEFVPFDQGLPRAGQWRDGFDLADLDGDGHLDIVFGPARKGAPVPNVYLGNGAGVWKRWADAGFPELAYDYGDAAVGDFDGDGHLDVVFGIHLRGLLALRQLPEGGFEPWTGGIQFDVPGQGGDASSFSSREVEILDWDGDGKVDIVAFGEGPKGRSKDREGRPSMVGSSRGVVLYRNLGGGRWEIGRLDSGKGTFGSEMSVADLDGDGATDLALASRVQGDARLAYLRQEEGTVDGRALPALRDGAFVEAIGTLPAEPGEPTAIVVGHRVQVDGVWWTALEILHGPDWEERTVLRARQDRVGVSAIRTGDLDGDGNADVVAGTGHGEIWVFLADGRGGYTSEDSEQFPEAVPGCSVSEIRLADLDGDGLSEMVASLAGEPVGISGIPGLSKPGCPREGSLRAWSPRRR